MSEEPPPPPLRLKPRVRLPDPETSPAVKTGEPTSKVPPASVPETPPPSVPPAASGAVPAQTVDSPPAAPAKLRIKPHFAPEPPAPPAGAVPPQNPSAFVPATRVPAPSSPAAPAPSLAIPPVLATPPALSSTPVAPKPSAPPRPPGPAVPLAPATGVISSPAVSAANPVISASPTPQRPVSVPVTPASHPTPTTGENIASTSLSAEAAKLKLRPRSTDSAPVPAAAEKNASPGPGIVLSSWAGDPRGNPASPSAPPVGSSSGRPSIPPFPVVAQNAPATAATAPIHIRAPGVVPEVTPGGIAKPEQHPAFKWGIVLTLSAFAVVLGGAGYLGWKFLAPNPTEVSTPPAALPSQPASTPAAPVVSSPSPTASPVTQPPVPTPSSPVAAGPVHAETPPGQNLMTPKPVMKPSGPPPLSQASSPVSTSVGPGVTAQTGVSISVSNASPAFRSFVANAKITGVFQGRNPRAVINGRVTRVGETVDHPLGIIFHDIDPQRKQIIFKDRTGAITTRKY